MESLTWARSDRRPGSARLITAVGLAVLFLASVLWLLKGATVPVNAAPVLEVVEEPVNRSLQAPGEVITVCLGGGCDYASVQAAVDAASPGDFIKVAQGTYTDIHFRDHITQVVYINKTVTIQGGYTITNWTTSFPITQPTVLDAQRKGRVLYVTGVSIFARHGPIDFETA